MSRMEIKVITYDQERLNYFTDLMKKAQKRYDRLYKKFANSPYLWEETELLNDAGREVQFYKDVIALLKPGYRKQKWISLEQRHPELLQECLCYRGNFKGDLMNTYTYLGQGMWKDDYGINYSTEEDGITHWMPLPEPPMMKGGAE